MAWVSVHDSVIGGKLRKLHKAMTEAGYPSVEELALGILVKFWLWGLKNADKDGRIMDADKDDIIDAFSTKLATQLPSVVDLLIQTGWIDEPQPGVFVIHQWDQWQEQWYKAMEKRAKNAGKMQEYRKSKKTPSPSEKIPSEEIPLPDIVSEFSQEVIPGVEPQEETASEEPDNSSEEQTGEKPEPKKTRKKKEGPPKKQYSEFVKMTEIEYQTLVSKYGEEFTKACIFKLDTYKGSNGKQYKDDYRAILSWVVERVQTSNPGLLRRSMSTIVNQASPNANPFAEYGGEQS